MLSSVIWLPVFISLSSASGAGRDLTKEPGHLKRFGDGRPSQLVEEMDGFPNSQEFLQKYVSLSTPLKMKGAAKLSPAYHVWTDEHFLSLQPTEDEQVLIEWRKKENRTQPATFMTLKEFVKIYNTTDQYMVNGVPKYLKGDVLLPCPLQCDNASKDHLIEALMWFSSGGTKSVVHTDSVDNINCLFRGEKELVMVDPIKYDHKVDLDHPEGSYSDVDVDVVDYIKYPGLADVEFYHVNMTAGDCLYIPYLWIHQVRSYGSNLAVNVWWDHYKFSELDPSICQTECNTKLTIDKVTFNGSNTGLGSKEAIKDRIKQIIGIHNTLTENQVVGKFLGPEELEALTGTDYKKLLRQIFRHIDLDHDGSLSRQELETVDHEAWAKVQDKMAELVALVETIRDEQSEWDEEREVGIIDKDGDDRGAGGNSKDEL